MIARLRRSLVVLGTVMALPFLVPFDALAASPGDLDPSFGGGDGMASITLAASSAEVGTVLATTGGKTIVLGQDEGGDTIVLARFAANGDPDPGFGGGDGLVAMDFLDTVDAFNAVVELPGGKLMVAADTSTSVGHDRLGLGRFKSDGAADGSFGGGDGKVILDFSVGFAAYDMVVLPSGKLLVSGESYPTADTNQSKFMVLRLKPSGQLDPTFGGGDGFVQTDFGNGNDGAWRMALDSHGRVVVAGWAQLGAGGEYATGVARYTPNGARDNTFSGDGKTEVNVVDGGDDYALGLGLQGDKIVLGEYATLDGTHVAMVRLLAGGPLDLTFGGGDGQVVMPNSGPTRDLDDLAVDGDNRILASGSVSTATQQMFVARFSSNGKLEFGFGTNGFATTAFGTDVGNLGMSVGGNGKIVVAGTMSGTDAAVARFLP